VWFKGVETQEKREEGVKMEKFKIIIPIFFLLIFLELVIIQLSEEISLIKMIEIGSVGLIIILYYYIIRKEVRDASKIIEERLMVVEKKFENIERRFDEDIFELKHLLRKNGLISTKRKR